MKGGKRFSCIVLDLDECLLHTMEPKYNHYEQIYYSDPNYMNVRGRLYSVNLVDVNTPEGTGVVERHWGVKRPHLNRFLVYICKEFDYVCVWSAGLYKYVIEIANDIFHGIGKPYLIFTRDNIPDPTGNYHKPLYQMLEHPSLKGKVTMADTVFLDDRLANFLTCPQNGINIPRYDPFPNEVLNDDIALLQVEQFFRSTEFQNATDVRKLDKSKIFTSSLNYLPSLEFNTNPIVYATEIPEKKSVYVPISQDITPFTYSMPALVYV